MRIVSLLRKSTPPLMLMIWQRLKYRMQSFQYRKLATYDNIEIAEIVANKNAIYRDTAGSTNDDSEDTAVFLSSLWFLQKFHNTQKFKVLDFGGGGGSHYFKYKAKINEELGNWIVIETPTMVDACYGLEDAKLSFTTLDDFEINSQAIDIIFSSCALQYTNSPEESLSRLLSLKAKVICFSRIVLINHSKPAQILEVSKLSGNGPILSKKIFKDKNISYKSTAMPLKDFESRIQELYTIKLRIEQSPPRAYQNAGIKNIQLMSYVAVLNPSQI